jgi:predicted amidohydrolase
VTCARHGKGDYGECCALKVKGKGHPGRRFPGFLGKSDSFYALCTLADEACWLARAEGALCIFDQPNELRNALWERLNHHKRGLQNTIFYLAVSEQPR